MKRGRKRAGTDQQREGFGQSLFEDIRFLFRFLRRRRAMIQWRRPSQAECAAIDGHPVLGHFGDQTIYLADNGAERWIARERDFWGFPGPPHFVFFAIEGDMIRVAIDFYHWPSCWTRAVDSPAPPPEL